MMEKETHKENGKDKCDPVKIRNKNYSTVGYYKY